MKLLSVNSDSKTIKGNKSGYLTGILYLAPHESGGVLSADGRPLNVCSNATPGCIASCLFTAGRGAFSNVREARARKTRELFADRKAFVGQLFLDVEALEAKAKRMGLKPAVRLNGTSDIAWEAIAGSLFDYFPNVQFYDYTKNPKRMLDYLGGKFPENYHLTFSLSELNREWARQVLALGGNVAAVFGIKPTDPKPVTWCGFPVIDADKDDLRFLDPKGTVAGLSAKGRAKQDRTGFVIRGI